MPTPFGDLWPIPVWQVAQSVGPLAKLNPGKRILYNVIKRTIREFAEADPPHLQVLQYVGISKDESYRIKPSRERYITIEYPLAQEGWTRADCINWMNLRYPDAPVGRSSCFFCPYHSIDEWRFIRHYYPNLYNEALALEQAFNNVPVGPFSLSRPPGLVKAMADRDMLGESPLDTERS